MPIEYKLFWVKLVKIIINIIIGTIAFWISTTIASVLFSTTHQLIVLIVLIVIYIIGIIYGIFKIRNLCEKTIFALKKQL